MSTPPRDAPLSGFWRMYFAAGRLFRRVGRLDYARSEIRMAVDHPWQQYRLRSCAKEPETVAWIEAEMKPGDVFYDVGANVGAYTLVAHAVGGGRCRIVAFEPGSGSYAALCKNILLNGAQECVVALPVALCAVRRLLTLTYSDTSPGAALHSIAGATPAGPSQTVLGFPLDELIRDHGLPHPSHLKVDVDGAEQEVIAGASRTLEDPRLRTMLIEIDQANDADAKLLDVLAAKGLTVQSRHLRGGSGTTFNYILRRDMR